MTRIRIVFICEIVGEVAKDAWRRPMMKQWADEIFDAADLLPITNRWKRVMTENLLLHAAYSEPKRFRHAERLTVPIRGVDGETRYVFGISIYEKLTGENKPRAPVQLDLVTYYEFAGLTPPGDA
ncbi:MAG: hypothetical protein VCF08_09785 [Alphaproteobacteria bacterium]